MPAGDLGKTDRQSRDSTYDPTDHEPASENALIVNGGYLTVTLSGLVQSLNLDTFVDDHGRRPFDAEAGPDYDPGPREEGL